MKATKRVAEDPGHYEAGRQVDRGVDDAPAQLVQMLHQAHAGKFCALADRGPRLAYCVRGINHVDLQSPRVGWEMRWMDLGPPPAQDSIAGTEPQPQGIQR